MKCFSLKKIVVFGAGPLAQQILKFQNLQVDYLIDSDKKKWRKEINNIKIYDPTILKRENKDNICIIISSLHHEKEISDVLDKMGFNRYKNYISFRELFIINNSRSAYYKDLLNNSNIELLVSHAIEGRVLIDQDKLKVYRGFYKEASEEYKTIYERCQQMGLFDDYLVDIKISDIKNIEPFDIVFEQKYIEPLTHPQEWSPKMFIEATNKAIDLQVILANNYLTLHDPGPTNMTYDKQFKWLDFGSIWSLDKIIKRKIVDYRNVNKFFYCDKAIDSFVDTIILNAKSKINMYDNDFTYSKAVGFLTEEEKMTYFNLRLEVLKKCKNNKFSEAFLLIKEYINCFDFTVDSNLFRYYDNTLKDNNSDKTIDNALSIIELISSDKMVVVDLGRLYNKKSISLLRHIKKEKQVILINDIPEFNDCLYDIIQINKMYNIVPVYSTIFNHLGVHIQKNYDDFYKRFNAELVVSIDSLEELVFSKQFTFDSIFKMFSNITTKYFLFSFNYESKVVFLNQNINRNEYEWYTYENMIKIHNKYFDAKRIIEISNTKKLILSRVLENH